VRNGPFHEQTCRKRVDVTPSGLHISAPRTNHFVARTRAAVPVKRRFMNVAMAFLGVVFMIGAFVTKGFVRRSGCGPIRPITTATMASTVHLEKPRLFLGAAELRSVSLISAGSEIRSYLEAVSVLLCLCPLVDGNGNQAVLATDAQSRWQSSQLVAARYPVGEPREEEMDCVPLILGGIQGS
jgi:hypothetical protein